MLENMKSQQGFKNPISISVAIYAAYYKGLGAALSLTVIETFGPYIFYKRANKNHISYYDT
jgi:hypothetical protein